MSTSSIAQSPLLFVIVGRNEPLYEAEFNKLPGATQNQNADSVTRQSYFVLHTALDLVDKSTWTNNNMYLKVVDKVCTTIRRVTLKREVYFQAHTTLTH